MSTMYFYEACVMIHVVGPKLYMRGIASSQHPGSPGQPRHFYGALSDSHSGGQDAIYTAELIYMSWPVRNSDDSIYWWVRLRGVWGDPEDPP